LNLLEKIRKILKISNFMKIRLVEAKLIHVDGWPDMMKQSRSSQSYKPNASKLGTVAAAAVVVVVVV